MKKLTNDMMERLIDKRDRMSAEFDQKNDRMSAELDQKINAFHAENMKTLCSIEILRVVEEKRKLPEWEDCCKAIAKKLRKEYKASFSMDQLQSAMQEIDSLYHKNLDGYPGTKE